MRVSPLSPSVSPWCLAPGFPGFTIDGVVRSEWLWVELYLVDLVVVSTSGLGLVVTGKKLVCLLKGHLFFVRGYTVVTQPKLHKKNFLHKFIWIKEIDIVMISWGKQHYPQILSAIHIKNSTHSMLKDFFPAQSHFFCTFCCGYIVNWRLSWRGWCWNDSLTLVTATVRLHIALHTLNTLWKKTKT